MCTEREAPVYSEDSDLKAEVWVFSRIGRRQGGPSMLLSDICWSVVCVLRVGPWRLRELSPCSGVSQSPGTVGLSKTCLSSLCPAYFWCHSGLLALCTSAPCWARVGVPSPKRTEEDFAFRTIRVLTPVGRDAEEMLSET